MSKPIFYQGQAVGCLVHGEMKVNCILPNGKISAMHASGFVIVYEPNGTLHMPSSRPCLYPIDQYREIIANLPAPQPEPWKPKPGEWCLFGIDNDEGGLVLRKYRDYNFNRFYDVHGTPWHTCYPFTGELPPHLKEVQP